MNPIIRVKVIKQDKLRTIYLITQTGYRGYLNVEVR